MTILLHIPSESASEKKLKIGHHFAKLWTTFIYSSLFYSTHSVHFYFSTFHVVAS